MGAVAVKQSSNDTTRKHKVKEQIPETAGASIFSSPDIAIQHSPSCPCGGGCPRCRGVIQPKLIINKPGDIYEQEADRVAEQVMRMPDPLSVLQFPVNSRSVKPSFQSISPHAEKDIQRKEDEEEERIVQMKQDSMPHAAGNQPGVPPSVHEVLSSPGVPLDPATRAYMEPRFGHDFSRVRVHSSPVAEQSAREVSANAYTVGHDIVFGTGRFVPETSEGQKLIAHELTHVVQQSRCSMAHEADAVRAAAAAVSGGAPVYVSAATGVGLARDVDPEVEKALGGLKEQEVPSESRQPAKPAAQNALTPDELIDEHVFGPRVHEEVGDLRKRLATKEARLETNPEDKALQKEVTEMRTRLRDLEGRGGIDPSARGANVPGVGNINTRAAIQVISPDGKVIAIERGSWGPTRHAEGNAIDKLRSRLGTQKLPAGTTIMVAGNQVVCGEVCKPDIARFAKDYGVPLENISASVRTRPKMVGQGQASGKTTERTSLRVDVPKATVKTEQLFPGGKEPPAHEAPPPTKPTGKPPTPKVTPQVKAPVQSPQTSIPQPSKPVAKTTSAGGGTPSAASEGSTPSPHQGTQAGGKVTTMGSTQQPTPGKTTTTPEPASPPAAATTATTAAKTPPSTTEAARTPSLSTQADASLTEAAIAQKVERVTEGRARVIIGKIARVGGRPFAFLKVAGNLFMIYSLTQIRSLSDAGAFVAAWGVTMAFSRVAVATRFGSSFAWYLTFFLMLEDNQPSEMEKRWMAVDSFLMENFTWEEIHKNYMNNYMMRYQAYALLFDTKPFELVPSLQENSRSSFERFMNQASAPVAAGVEAAEEKHRAQPPAKASDEVMRFVHEEAAAIRTRLITGGDKSAGTLVGIDELAIVQQTTDPKEALKAVRDCLSFFDYSYYPSPQLRSMQDMLESLKSD